MNFAAFQVFNWSKIGLGRMYVAECLHFYIKFNASSAGFKIILIFCLVRVTATYPLPALRDDSFRHIAKAAEIFVINFIFIFIVPSF